MDHCSLTAQVSQCMLGARAVSATERARMEEKGVIDLLGD
jgi:hypothetical protein